MYIPNRIYDVNLRDRINALDPFQRLLPAGLANGTARPLVCVARALDAYWTLGIKL